MSGSGLRSGSGPGPEARFCAQCCGPVLSLGPVQCLVLRPDAVARFCAQCCGPVLGRVLVSGPILALVLAPRRCPNPFPPDAVVPVWGTAQSWLKFQFLSTPQTQILWFRFWAWFRAWF